MTRTVPAFCLFLAFVAAASASSQAAPPVPSQKAPTWEEEVAAWKQNRFERLQRPDGWLTLVGLGWLKEGDNSIGSDPKSGVPLPVGKAPARLGTLRLTGTGAQHKLEFRAEKDTRRGKVEDAGFIVLRDGDGVTICAVFDDDDRCDHDGLRSDSRSKWNRNWRDRVRLTMTCLLYTSPSPRD